MKRQVFLIIFSLLVGGLMMLLVVMKAVHPPEGSFHPNFIYHYQMKKMEFEKKTMQKSNSFNLLPLK